MKVRSRLSCFQRRMDGWNHHHPGYRCCCHPPCGRSLLVVDCMVCFAARVCSCWLKGSCCWLRGSFTINFLALADDLVTSALFFLLTLGALTGVLSSPFTFPAFFFNFLLSATLGVGGWSEDTGGVASSSERI